MDKALIFQLAYSRFSPWEEFKEYATIRSTSSEVICTCRHLLQLKDFSFLVVPRPPNRVPGARSRLSGPIFFDLKFEVALIFGTPRHPSHGHDEGHFIGA